MKAKVNLSKKDIAVAIGCVVFLVMNIGAIGSGGRMKARDTLCRSNLRQWGVMFQMYAEDNDGMLGDGNWTGGDWGSRKYREWVNFLRPYYKNNYELCLCPMATRPWSRGGRGKWSAWGIFPGICPYTGVNWDAEAPGYAEAQILGAWEPEYPGDRGSYGMNGWCHGMPENENNVRAGKMATGRPLRNAWLTLNVKNADTIPLLLDANWLFGTPTHYDVPPDIEFGVTQPTGPVDNMWRFTVNRHNGYVNSLFLDFSVRPVGIKELWILKWSRKYIIDGDWGENPGAIQIIQMEGWPPWMAEFKEYFDMTP